MCNEQSVDLTKKTGRAIRLARIGLNLMRAVILWPHLDNKQREGIEKEMKRAAPGWLDFFYYACRSPSQSARNNILNEVIGRYEKVMEYAAESSPGFIKELEDFGRELIRYKVADHPGIPILRFDSA